jgi:hypothetical protein
MIQVKLQQVFAEYHTCMCTLLNALKGGMIAGLSV